MPIQPHKPIVSFLRTYRFRAQEKDPIIDRVRTCMEDTGTKLGDLAKQSGLSRTTIFNWMDGPTRRPQYATVCAAIRAMGFDFAIVPSKHKINGKSWSAEMPPMIRRFRSAKEV